MYKIGGYIGTSGLRGPFDVLDIRKQHNKWLRNNESIILETLDEIGNDAVYWAQNQHKVKNRSGALKAGWKKAFQKRPNRYSVALISRVKHAYFQELGTGLWGPSKSRIYPVKAKFLRWIGPGGKPIFRRSVRGVPPKFIGKTAAFEAWGLGKHKFARAIDRAATRF